MEHVVFFPAADGSPSFRRVADLEEAVRLVEHLRNVKGVAEVRVHPLGEEVPLAFRTWYRVEVPSTEGSTPEETADDLPSAADPAPDGPLAAASHAAPLVVPTLEVVPGSSAQPTALPVPAASVEDLLPEQQAQDSVPAPEAEAQAAPVEEPADRNGHRDSVQSLGFFAT